jgi:hypothetical protein
LVKRIFKYLFYFSNLFLVGSVLMTFISLIPSSLNARKKVLLPLIKAKLHIEDEKEEDLM